MDSTLLDVGRARRRRDVVLATCLISTLAGCADASDAPVLAEDGDGRGTSTARRNNRDNGGRGHGNGHGRGKGDSDGDRVPDRHDVCPNGTTSTGALGRGCADGCASGYLANATGTYCNDMDECAAPDACGSAAACTNSPGSYACTPCTTGYEASGDGRACVNIDECAVGGAGELACEVALGGVCWNTPGSYACTMCSPGTSPGADRTTCVPPDISPMFTLTTSSTAPNGAWSWFEDERAIIDARDPQNPRLLVSSVSSAPNGDDESGDIDLLWRDLNTGVQGEFELENRLERDDHDSAALYIRPDGRYLAMYSRHIGDNLTRWRISTNPHDPTSWEPIRTLNNGAGTTYNNVYFLPNEGGASGRLYNFTRAVNFDPMVQISNDNGTTWSNVGKLLTQGGSSDRPYVRYASDGDKIHLISTEEHPRDFANSVYHGYIQNGVLFDSYGVVIDPNIFDANGVSPTRLTPVFVNGTSFGGTTMNRAWTISLELDNTGNPVAIFTARANDSASDHRFFYGRFDGTAWRVHEMADAGGFLYAAEDDYTGLASIDPDNPNVVYMSSRIDPRSDATTAKYELYRGVTTDFGESWTWLAITVGSTVDNLRPVVPSWNGQETILVWMRGTYTTYASWDTEIVGVRISDAGRRSLLWQGSSATPNAWDGAANWDSGGGGMEVYREGDEVAFDDSALTHDVTLETVITPMGVTFNNSVHAYTVSGGGIGGTGGVRVLGGGTVTLSNGVNRYTGETLVSNGTLLVGGSATLGASSHIHVGSLGTLASSSPISLNGQRLTAGGEVTGDLHGINGSSIELLASGELVGDVTLRGSALSGVGQITGSLSGHDGTEVSVGGDGFNVRSAFGPSVYRDATAGTSGNTSLATGAVFSPSTSGSVGDNVWKQRAFGASVTIFEAGGDGPENTPPLTTTLGGFVPGKTYQVSVMFWDADAGNGVQDWNIRAGFSPSAMTFFANGTTSDAIDLGATGAVLGSSLAPYSTPPSLFLEGGRTLLAGNVGQIAATDTGQIQLFLDDLPSTIGANNRTWYDGITVREVIPTPTVVQLSIGGSYAQDADSSLWLDVHSPQALDRLSVSGTFTAAGTLVVTMVAGASAPVEGDTFQLIEAGAFSGGFDAVVLPALPLGLAWDVASLRTAGSITVVSAP